MVSILINDACQPPLTLAVALSVLLLSAGCASRGADGAATGATSAPAQPASRALSSGAPSSAPAAGGAAVTAVAQQTRFLAACQVACERQSMMRAVGAEMITQDCKASCKSDWALPACTTQAELTKLIGQRVRVFGTADGNALTLADGTRLPLVDGSAIDGFPGAGAQVVVVATLSSAGAENVSCVASLE